MRLNVITHPLVAPGAICAAAQLVGVVCIICLGSVAAGPGALARSGGDPVVLLREGVNLRRDAKYAAACEVYARALQLTPGWPIALYEKAHCTRLLGDLDGLAAADIAQAEEALKRPPVYIEMGRVAEDRGQSQEARVAYRKALALAPAEVRAQAGLVRLSDPKEGKKALKRIETHLVRYPRDVAAWRKLAQVAEKLRKYKVAEAALEQVIAVSPNKRAAAASMGTFGKRTRRRSAQAKALEALNAATRK